MKDQTLDALGTFHPGPLGRDAIHVAVIQVRSTTVLRRGQPVRVDPATHLASPIALDQIDRLAAERQLVGLVDPFLTVLAVPPGTRVFVCLWPRTITGLRHEWTHPSDINPSEVWLQQWCTAHDWTYEAFLQQAREDLADGGDSLFVGDDQAQDDAREEAATLLGHLATVLGIVPPSTEGFYFRCAC